MLIVFIATLIDCHINYLIMIGFYTSDEVGCIMVWCGRPSGCLSVGLSSADPEGGGTGGLDPPEICHRWGLV